MQIRITNSYLFGLTKSEVLWEVRKFNVGSATTFSQAQAYASSSREDNWNTVLNLEEGSDDIGTQDSPGVIAQIFRDTVTEFMLLPPWGYIVLFNQKMASGTASTTYSDIAISFPDSSPVAGLTGTLPLKSAVEDAIQTVRDNGYTSEYGDSWDTIQYYWVLFWYVVFLFWFLREIAGIGGFSFGSRSNISEEQKQSMTLRVGKGSGSPGTIDMRR